MKKYVVDRPLAPGKYDVIECTFEPQGHLGIAPDGATIDSGDYISMVDGSPVLDAAGLAAKHAADAKEVQKADLYKEMYVEVVSTMKTDLGAASSEAATADYLMWQMMIDDPAYFSGQGLLDDAEVEMVTDSQITAYATSKIAAAKAYALYRAKRKKKFSEDKALI